MIEFATHDNYSEIIKLWEICFGDRESYIKNFLDCLLTTENCLVYKENSAICAMLFTLKGDLVAGGSRSSAFYIYAACTKPSYRNRGIMSRLIDYATEYACKNGIEFLCLVPANESLFDYYAKLGFQIAFKRKELMINRSVLNLIADKDSESHSPDMTEIADLRDNALSSIDYFSWGADVVAYSIIENREAGGISVFASHNGSLVGYAIFSESDDTVNVKEFCTLEGHTGHVMNILLQASNKNLFYFHLPVDFPFSTDDLSVTNNGMALPLSSKAKQTLERIRNAYIGLTLE